MQDVELTLRFFAIHDQTYLNYKGAMKNFLNAYMKSNQNMDPSNIEKRKIIFRHAISMVRTVFGDNAFYLYSIRDNKVGKYERVINKGLFDVLMFGFTRYTQHQVMPCKDSLKEELLYLMTDNDEFINSITGAGTDSKTKLEKKFTIWLDALDEVIGSPRNEPRCFSWELKNQLWEKSPTCQICKQHIESIDDAEVDHIEFYWRGGRTIPENARLVHRFCNRSRRSKGKADGVILVRHEHMVKIEDRIREEIDVNLSQKKYDYWNDLLPEGIRTKVDERVRSELTKFPYKKDEFKSCKSRLNFCDIRDYRKIIESNWDVFAEIFFSRTELEKHFNNFADYRNQVSHGRTVDSVARKNGEAAMEWISRVLDLEE